MNCYSQLGEGQLLHYMFDGDANDVSGNEYHGLPSGIIFTEDRNGNPNAAVYFDGFDDFIDLPNISELKPDLPVSFSFWINYESENYMDKEVFNTSFEDDISAGVFFNATMGSNKYSISYGDGSPFYNSGSRRTFVTDNTIEINVWHHIVAIVEGPTNMIIYIDCIAQEGNYSGSGGELYYSDAAGSIGRHDRDLGDPPNYFKGSIDEFRYWDRRINFDEVMMLCENPLSALDEVQNQPELKLFPNPALHSLHLKTSLQINTVLIHNSLGQLVYSGTFSETISIEHLPSGAYFLKALGDTTTLTKRFLVE